MARSTWGASVYRRVARPIGHSQTLGVTYKTGLTLDVLKPDAAGRPAVILAHGGGWFEGDNRDAAYVSMAHLLASAGFAVFNIDYTLVTPGNTSDDHQLGGVSDPVDDIRDAVQWVRDNAATYNADADRVGVLGISAGGHLALLAACLGMVGKDRPDAVAAWSPPTRLTALFAAGELLAADYLGAALSGNQALWEQHSPYHRVTAACCPIRIVGSDDEDPAEGVPEANYDDLHAAASAARADSTKVVYSGTVHGDFRRLDMGGTIDWLLSKLGNGTLTTSRSAATGRAAASGRSAA